MNLYRLLPLSMIILSSCTQQPDGAAKFTVPEAFLCDQVVGEDIDSVALWHGREHDEWLLLSTAKRGDAVYVYDATNGELLSKVGSTGTALGEFKRPNGIAIFEDTLFIVERDNHRMQAFALPSGEPLTIWAEDQLVKPYGISGYVVSPGNYRLYVTDENPQRAAKQMYIYDITRSDNNLVAETAAIFGDESGPGQLHKVESICVDEVHNRVFVADEHRSQKNIKIYDLSGKFTGQTIGKGLFGYEAEGICVYPTSDTAGYILCTDQTRADNRFHIFDRESLKYITTFRGDKTVNVDGVAITNEPIGHYPHGLFFAVNDDGTISAFDWDSIFTSCHLK